MKRAVTILVGLIALVAVVGTASAALRAPQVPIFGGCLQGELNAQGESINAATDQQHVLAAVPDVEDLGHREVEEIDGFDFHGALMV